MQFAISVITGKVYRPYRYQVSALETCGKDTPNHVPPTSIVVKVRAISLYYQDANGVHGDNAWPVLASIIPCYDAAGEITAVGAEVKELRVGDRVSPIFDQASITGQE